MDLVEMTKRRDIRNAMAGVSSKEWVRRQRSSMDRKERLRSMRLAGLDPDSPEAVRRWTKMQRAKRSET